MSVQELPQGQHGLGHDYAAGSTWSILRSIRSLWIIFKFRCGISRRNAADVIFLSLRQGMALSANTDLAADFAVLDSGSVRGPLAATRRPIEGRVRWA